MSRTGVFRPYPRLPRPPKLSSSGHSSAPRFKPLSLALPLPSPELSMVALQAKMGARLVGGLVRPHTPPLPEDSPPSIHVSRISARPQKAFKYLGLPILLARFFVLRNPPSRAGVVSVVGTLIYISACMVHSSVQL